MSKLKHHLLLRIPESKYIKLKEQAEKRFIPVSTVVLELIAQATK